MRLGCESSEEVVDHPFFEDIDLDALMRKEIKAPFIPKEFDYSSLNMDDVDRSFMRLDLFEYIIPEENIK